MMLEVFIVVISVFDLDFLLGDYFDKFWEEIQILIVWLLQIGNEDNYLNFDIVRVNKKVNKKKVVKKKDKNKILWKM